MRGALEVDLEVLAPELGHSREVAGHDERLPARRRPLDVPRRDGRVVHELLDEDARATVRRRPVVRLLVRTEGGGGAI